MNLSDFTSAECFTEIEPAKRRYRNVGQRLPKWITTNWALASGDQLAVSRAMRGSGMRDSLGWIVAHPYRGRGTGVFSKLSPDGASSARNRDFG